MIFKESTHEYLEGGIKYTSITSLIKNYHPKTDWDGIAQKYLDKHGSPEKVLKDISKKKNIPIDYLNKKFSNQEYTIEWIQGIWKWIADTACEIGSEYHLVRENRYSKLSNVIYNPVIHDEKPSCDLSNLEKGFIYPELICYSHEHQLCGQADVVTITPEGKVKIRDFKTSRVIETEPTAYWNPKLKKKVVKKFISPLTHLPLINYYEYALQLSCYAYMLELHGFPLLYDRSTGQACLIIEHVHFTDRFLGLIDESKNEDIYVPYLKTEVKAMFAHHKASLECDN